MVRRCGFRHREQEGIGREVESIGVAIVMPIGATRGLATTGVTARKKSRRPGKIETRSGKAIGGGGEALGPQAEKIR